MERVIELAKTAQGRAALDMAAGNNLFERREPERERQTDTRRKILLGTLWMQELKNGDAAVLEKAKAKLDTDRELFGLPPLDPSEPFQPTEFGED